MNTQLINKNYFLLHIVELVRIKFKLSFISNKRQKVSRIFCFKQCDGLIVGLVWLSKLQCVEKLSELFKFVTDKTLNDDSPKTSSYFDTFSLSYTVKKLQMCDVSKDDSPNDVKQRHYNNEQ